VRDTRAFSPVKQRGLCRNLNVVSWSKHGHALVKIVIVNDCRHWLKIVVNVKV
jgi:hypothetical protein